MNQQLFTANTKSICVSLLIFFISTYAPITCGQSSTPSSIKYAELGDCILKAGERIKECVIGYQTVGSLNADSSNAILIPTWLAGTSQEMTALTAAGAMADSTKYFVILADAFGNGISSSPSTSTLQPDESFPSFTIRDMVDAHYRLIIEEIGLDHLYAVIGISMGGMQAFEWMFRYPAFVDVVIPILGSPRLSYYDQLLWNTELEALKLAGDNENQGKKAGMKAVALIHARNLYSPEYISKMSSDRYQKYIQEMKVTIGSVNPYDWASQLYAMLNHNVYDRFEGNIQKAANQVKARMMIVSSKYDHIVDPKPALKFAEISGANVLELSNLCGHQAVLCRLDFVNQQVSVFLNN